MIMINRYVVMVDIIVIIVLLFFCLIGEGELGWGDVFVMIFLNSIWICIYYKLNNNNKILNDIFINCCYGLVIVWNCGIVFFVIYFFVKIFFYVIFRRIV